MTKNNIQYTLYKSGRVSAFVYNEDNPYPINIDKETNESATYDKSLLEQKFTDLWFESKKMQDMMIMIGLIGGVIVIGLLIALLFRGGG